MSNSMYATDESNDFGYVFEIAWEVVNKGKMFPLN